MTFERFVYNLIGRNVFPGISVLVGQGEGAVFQRHYGFKCLVPQKEIIKKDTLYDLASLTKPLVTAFLMVYLKEKEKIKLDSEIKSFLPDLPLHTNILQLLTHTSGLPDWRPLYLWPDHYLHTLKTIRLESTPGKRVNYSCLGYILLYFLIEKISGSSFMDLARDIIFNPLKLQHTFLKIPENLKNSAAPTEEGNTFEKQRASRLFLDLAKKFNWREYIIKGETHDGNAFYAGGSAGNAGLFSTAGDLFKISREFFPATATILSPESLQLFWGNYTPRQPAQRTVGFKLNSSFMTSGGRALSQHAVGHNGFTGTSIWLEPEEQTVFIILTNRVHPRVQNINFNRIRRKLHKLLKKELSKTALP